MGRGREREGEGEGGGGGNVPAELLIFQELTRIFTPDLIVPVSASSWYAAN